MRAGKQPAARSADKARSPRVSMVDEATEAIRNRILDLSLPPGKPISSKWLVENLKLGRTPIREALNRLAAEGLIQIEANQSVLVQPLDIGEINQIMDALWVAERISASYCDLEDPRLLKDVADMQARQRQSMAAHRYLEASHWNVAFRTRIAETSRNHHLIEFYRRTINHSRRLSCMIYAMEARDPDYYKQQVKMLEDIHRSLREALTAKDRPRLIQVLAEHVGIFKSRIAWMVQRSAGPELSLD
jgi:DNA-binding GntR family transcriptional regulator